MSADRVHRLPIRGERSVLPASEATRAPAASVIVRPTYSRPHKLLAVQDRNVATAHGSVTGHEQFRLPSLSVEPDRAGGLIRGQTLILAALIGFRFQPASGQRSGYQEHCGIHHRVPPGSINTRQQRVNG